MRKEQPPLEPAEKPSRSVGEKVLPVLSVAFFTLAVAVFLVMIYVNTADDLSVSPYLSPTLFLLFGGGIGLGMLFRSIARRENNSSSINFCFKIAFSVLILLTVILSFLLSVLKILH